VTFSPSIEDFKESLEQNPPLKVRGQAVFLTGNPDRIPQAAIQNLNHNKIMHNDVAILHLRTENVPRVPNLEKIEAEKLAGGLYRIIAHHGFMETPKMEAIFALARDKGVQIRFETSSFFLGKEKLIIGDYPKMGKWRSYLFQFLSKNAMDASSYFGIPSNQVIEVGVQFEL
jgi:KUP system potassium uptake protein